MPNPRGSNPTLGGVAADLTGLADGDSLVWNAADGRFVPGVPAGGGGAAVAYGAKFGRESTADIVVPIGPAVPLNLDGPYGPQDSIGITWNAAIKQFESADGGTFVVEWGVGVNAIPGADAGYSVVLAGTYGRTGGPAFFYDPTVDSPYGKQWTAATAASGDDYYPTTPAGLVMPAGGTVQILLDATDPAVTVNYAYAQFTRVG